MSNDRIIHFPLFNDRLEATREVQEHEDFASLILDSTYDGIYAWDRSLCYTIWNTAMERMTGLLEKDVLGRQMFSVFPVLLREGFDKKIAEVLSGKTITDESSFFVAENGKQVISQTVMTPLEDETGEIVGGLSVARDISEKVQLIQQLQRMNLSLEERIRDRTQDLEGAVKNLKLEIAQRQKVEQALRFTAEVGMRLGNSLEPKVIIKTALAIANEFFSGWCALRLLCPDGTLEKIFSHENKMLERRMREIENDPTFAPSDSVGPLRTIKTGQTQWHPFLSDETLRQYTNSDQHFSEMKKLGFKSYICVALLARGQILGTLSFYSSARFYESEDLRVAEDFARRFAMALDNARTYAAATNGEPRFI